jgi:hypothetical protein
MKVELVIHPQSFMQFQEFAEEHKLDYEVLTENLQE